MLSGCLTVMLALCCQAAGKLERPEAVSQQSGDAAKELKEKSAKAASAKSYAFELKTEREMGSGSAAGGGAAGGGAAGGGAAGGGAAGGGGGGHGGRGRGGPPTDNVPTIGKYVESQPVELKHGELVAYRQGEKLVYLKNGAWELNSNERGGGDKGGGGKSGGDAGGAKGGGDAGGGGGNRHGGGDMRDRFLLGSLAFMRLPHELLAGVDAKLTDVKASDEAGKRVFVGNLDKEAADELSGAKRAREMGMQRGNGDTTATGTMKIVFAKDGSVETLTVETKTVGGIGEVTTKQTYTLKDFDATKVEPPKEAIAKLGGAAGSH